MSVLSTIGAWDLSLRSPPFILKKQIKIAKSFKLIVEKDASMNIVRETKTEQGSKEIHYIIFYFIFEIHYINCMNLIILKSKFPKSIHNFCYCIIANFSNASWPVMNPKSASFFKFTVEAPIISEVLNKSLGIILT
jgi:hypothetical protein